VLHFFLVFCDFVAGIFLFDGPPYEPLAVILVVLAPLWIAWRVCIAMFTTPPRARSRLIFVAILGVVATVLSIASLTLAAQLVITKGPLFFRAADAVSHYNNPRQGRGLLLIWVWPSLLLLLTVAATGVSLAKLRSVARLILSLSPRSRGQRSYPARSGYRSRPK
jgi:hypothetical protein